MTAYDTLGARGVEHSLVESDARAMYVDPHLLKTAAGPLESASSVEILIYNEISNQPVPDEEIQSFKDEHPRLRVVSFEELRAMGEQFPVEVVAPSPGHLYCIMYTSGTTGPPKVCPSRVRSKPPVFADPMATRESQ